MMNRLHVLPVLLALAATALAEAPTHAQDLRFNEAEARHQKDQPTRAKEFSAGALTLLIPLTDLRAPDTETVELRCAARAGTAGVKIDFVLRYFTADRNLIAEVSERSKTLEDGWTAPVKVPPLIEGPPAGTVFWASAQPRGGKRTDEVRIRCVHAPSSFCDGSLEEVCS